MIDLNKMAEDLSLSQTMLVHTFEAFPKKSRIKAVNELARLYRKTQTPILVLQLKLVEACIRQKRVLGCFTRDTLHELWEFSNADYPLFLKQLRSFGLFKVVSEERNEVKVIELVDPLFRGYVVSLGANPEQQLDECLAYAIDSGKRKAPKAPEPPKPSKESPPVEMPATEPVERDPNFWMPDDYSKFLNTHKILLDGANIKNPKGRYAFVERFSAALRDGELGFVRVDVDEGSKILAHHLGKILDARFTGPHRDWLPEGIHYQAILASILSAYRQRRDLVAPPSNRMQPDPELAAACPSSIPDLEFMAELGIDDSEAQRLSA